MCVRAGGSRGEAPCAYTCDAEAPLTVAPATMRARPTYSTTSAMTSTSQSAPFGSAPTSTQLRAGLPGKKRP